MISRKVEIVIFAVILVILSFVCSSLIAEIQLNHVPYNKALTPEEVIEKELPVYIDDVQLHYSYKIISNSLFVLVDTGLGVDTLFIGFKNTQSGYTFNNSRNMFKKYSMMRYKRDPEEDLIFVEVTRITNDFTIKVTSKKPYEERSSVLIKDQDNQLLDTMNVDGQTTYWIDAFEKVPDGYQLYADLNNNKTIILDKDEILSFFGGQL